MRMKPRMDQKAIVMAAIPKPSIICRLSAGVSGSLHQLSTMKPRPEVQEFFEILLIDTSEGEEEAAGETLHDVLAVEAIRQNGHRPLMATLIGG